MRTVCLRPALGGTDGGPASAQERGGAWRDAAVAGIHWAGQDTPPRSAPPPHTARSLTDRRSTRGERHLTRHHQHFMPKESAAKLCKLYKIMIILQDKNCTVEDFTFIIN